MKKSGKGKSKTSRERGREKNMRDGVNERIRGGVKGKWSEREREREREKNGSTESEAVAEKDRLICTA